jgi:hypothetical protein
LQVLQEASAPAQGAIAGRKKRVAMSLGFLLAG